MAMPSSAASPWCRKMGQSSLVASLDSAGRTTRVKTELVKCDRSSAYNLQTVSRHVLTLYKQLRSDKRSWMPRRCTTSRPAR